MKNLTNEEVKKLFTDRLVRACDDANIKPLNKGRGAFLAKQLGITTGTVSKYFTGKSLPTFEVLARLCDILHKDSSYFDFIYTKTPPIYNDMAAFDVVKNVVPLISWSDLVDFPGVDYFIKKEGVELMFTILKESQDDCIALTVDSDAMQWDGNPSFPPGTKIVVDTSKKASSGSFVIFEKKGEKLGYFKQYIDDSGQRYLRALNDRYLSVPMSEDIKIIGVVVQSITDL